MSEADRWLKDFDYELDKVIENSKKADTATAFKLIREPITLVFLSAMRELEYKNNLIQKLEHENVTLKNFTSAVFNGIDISKDYIERNVVKKGLEDIEYYFDRLNGPDEDIEYIRKVTREILEGGK